MITRDEALTANVFHQVVDQGTRCIIWRRNGQTKTWKRDPERFRLPVKHGLYSYDAITDDMPLSDRAILHTEANCPHAK